MYAKIKSFILHGIDAVPVTVECETRPGIGIHFVGVPDAAVKECLLRTVTAMQSCGYRIPGQKIVINIAPQVDASCNAATGLDLPVALALLAASGQQPQLQDADGWYATGELALDGMLRAVPGTVQMVDAARRAGAKGVVIPRGNGLEVAPLFDDSVPVYGACSLYEALTAVAGMAERPVTVWDDPANSVAARPQKKPCTWDTLAGMDAQKRALEIAAAGGHHILLVGAPDGGRAHLAKALADILPPMDAAERLAVAKVYSAQGYVSLRDMVYKACGLYGNEAGGRPFRAPHRDASIQALAGGGAVLRPGEVSLAHGGVLYEDDYAMLPRASREILRTALEDGSVTLRRLKGTAVMPARFQLVLGADACPCGRYGEGDTCTCSTEERSKYLARLDGPVMDHVDIQTWVQGAQRADTPQGEARDDVAARVAAARARQQARQGKLNGAMKARDIEAHCALSDESRTTLENIIERLGLSARAYSRILRVARTIADLEGSDMITAAHVAEAASYRFLDRHDTK